MAETFKDRVDVVDRGAGRGGTVTVILDARNRVIELKSGNRRRQVARILLKDADGDTIIALAANGNLMAGGGGKDGDIILKDSDGNVRVELGAEEGRLRLRNSLGEQILDLGSNGNLEAGGGGKDGDLLLNKSDGSRTVHIDGNRANIVLGGGGEDGDIIIFDDSVTDTSDFSQATIHIRGNSGDIVLRGADCSEEFAVLSDVPVEPGTVLVMDERDGEEVLRPCSAAYDKRVAGVASGAGDYRPGIVLDRRSGSEPRVPVALVGKAFCKVDAETAPIELGDLLTTSLKTGFAMKATDPARAFGAVIGKAMRGLARGQGLIPVLISLQ